jgi:hypothetical protein
MAIPPGSIRVDYDFSNPSCYSGSGTTVNNLAPFPLISAQTNGLFVSQGNSSHFSFNGLAFGSGQILQSAFFDFIGNTFTFNVWCQMQGTAVDKPIFNFAGPYGLTFRGNTSATGTFNARMTGPGYAPSISSACSNDTWFLFTIWCDATTFKLYRNGVLVSSGAFVGSLPTGSNSFYLGGTGAVNNAKCKVARFQYYTAALDDADILDYYNNTKLYFPKNSYDFSNVNSYPGTGNTVIDLTGNTNLVIIDSPTYVGAGTSSYFQFSNNFIGQVGITGLGSTFTISVWSQVAQGYLFDGTVFSAGKQITGENPQINYNNLVNNAINFSFQNTTNITSPFIGDQWQNITVTADGTNSKLYVDGSFVTSTSQAGSAWTSGGFVLGKGVDSDGNPQGNALTGKIALLTVYNTAIGSTDVAAIYNTLESRFIFPYVGSVGGRIFGEGLNG